MRAFALVLVVLIAPATGAPLEPYTPLGVAEQSLGLGEQVGGNTPSKEANIPGKITVLAQYAVEVLAERTNQKLECEHTVERSHEVLSHAYSLVPFDVERAHICVSS